MQSNTHVQSKAKEVKGDGRGMPSQAGHSFNQNSIYVINNAFCWLQNVYDHVLIGSLISLDEQIRQKVVDCCDDDAVVELMQECNHTTVAKCSQALISRDLPLCDKHIKR